MEKKLDISCNFVELDTTMDNAVKKIYTGCDKDKTNSVPVSILLNFITPYLADNVSELAILRNILDPNGSNPGVSAETFYSAMSEWTSTIQNRSDSSNGESFSVEQPSFVHSTPRINLDRIHLNRDTLNAPNTSSMNGNLNNSTALDKSDLEIENSRLLTELVKLKNVNEENKKIEFEFNKIRSELESVKLQLISSEEQNESSIGEINRLKRLLAFEKQINENLEKKIMNEEDILQENEIIKENNNNLKKNIIEAEKREDLWNQKYHTLENNYISLKDKYNIIQKKEEEALVVRDKLQKELNRKEDQLNGLVAQIEQLNEKYVHEKKLVEHLENEKEVIYLGYKQVAGIQCHGRPSGLTWIEPSNIYLHVQLNFSGWNFNLNWFKCYEHLLKNNKIALEKIIQENQMKNYLSLKSSTKDAGGKPLSGCSNTVPIFDVNSKYNSPKFLNQLANPISPYNSPIADKNLLLRKVLEASLYSKESTKNSLLDSSNPRELESLPVLSPIHLLRNSQIFASQSRPTSYIEDSFSSSKNISAPNLNDVCTDLGNISLNESLEDDILLKFQTINYLQSKQPHESIKSELDNVLQECDENENVSGIDKLKQQIIKLKNENSEFRVENLFLCNKNKELQTVTKNLEDIKTQLCQEIDQIRKSIQDKSLECDKLQQHLSLKEGIIKNRDDSLKILQLDNGKLQSLIDVQSNKIEEIEQQNLRIKNLSSENKQLLVSCNALQMDIENLEKIKTDYEKKLEEYQINSHEYSVKCQELQEQLEFVLKENEIALEEIQEKKKEIGKLKNENNEIKQLLDDLYVEKDSFKHNCVEFERLLENEKCCNAELKEKLNFYVKDLENFKRNYLALEKDLDQEILQSTVLKDEFDNSKRHYNQLLENLQKQLKEKEDKFKEILIERDNRIVMQQGEYENLKYKYNTQRELSESVCSPNSFMKHRKISYDKQQMIIEKLQLKYDDVLTILQNEKRKNQQLQNIHRKLQEENEALMLKVGTIEEQYLQENQRLQNEISMLNEQIDRLKDPVTNNSSDSQNSTSSKQSGFNSFSLHTLQYTKLQDHSDVTSNSEEEFMSAMSGSRSFIGDNEFILNQEVFPSNGDSFLSDLGLQDDNPREVLSFDEVEKQFTTLALAFLSDSSTINQRYEREHQNHYHIKTIYLQNFDCIINKIKLLDGNLAKMLEELKIGIVEIIRTTKQIGLLSYEFRMMKCWNIVTNYVAMLRQNLDESQSELRDINVKLNKQLSDDCSHRKIQRELVVDSRREGVKVKSAGATTTIFRICSGMVAFVVVIMLSHIYSDSLMQYSPSGRKPL